MRHFFIDLENVRSYGLEGVLLLKPEDMIYVFYSDNANTLTIPTIESLNESPATVKYIKTNYTGANAMDFQIVTLLGATIERDKSGSFYIISHDNGFKSAVKFCEGYFTSYDIVTGVFANIILAINSEKSGKQSVSGDEQVKQQNKRSRHRKKSSGKANENIQQEENAAVVENEAEKIKETVDDKGNAPENADNSVGSDDDTSSMNKEHNKNRRSRSRHRSRNKNRDERKETQDTAANEIVQDNVVAESKAEEKKDDMSDAEQSDNRKKSRRSRRHKSSGKNDNTENTAAENVAVDSESKEQKKTEQKKDDQKKSNQKKPEASVKKGKNTEYLYKTLSDYLSKSTIDMYANVIDEGVRVSNNKNDLHGYFKKKYAADEAEALFKIIGSDFAELKKQSQKN